MKNKLKGAFKSRTVWFGMAVAALSWLQQALPGMEGLSPVGVTIIGTFVSAGIVALRAVTVEPLENKV